MESVSNRCVKDLKSPFYLDVAALNPSVSEVIDLIHKMGGKAYLAHPSSYFSKNGSKEEVNKAYNNTKKFVRDFMKLYSPRVKVQSQIDGLEVYHPSYLGNMDVINEMKEIVRSNKLGSSGGTDIHVDKTMGEDETVSSNSLKGKQKRSINRFMLRKFSYLRKKAMGMEKLKEKVEKMETEKTER